MVEQATIRRELPAEIIADFVRRYKGYSHPLIAAVTHHPHFGIAHYFYDWRSAMISTGVVPDMQNDDSADERLFKNFCRQLRENGVTLSPKTKKAAFKEYLED